MVSPQKLVKIFGVAVLVLIGSVVAIIVCVFLWLQFYHRDLPDVTQLKAFAPTHPAVIRFDACGESTLANVVPLAQMSEPLKAAVIVSDGEVDPRNWMARTYHDLTSDVRHQRYGHYSSHVADHLVCARFAQIVRFRTTIQVERHLTPDQIFTVYLNRVYLGHNLLGVENASEYYFGKHASELSPEEGALIAGIIRSPSRFSPELHPDRALKRRNETIDRMLQNGKLTKGEAERAKNVPIRLTARPQTP